MSFPEKLDAALKPKQTFVPTDSCCDARIRKALLEGLQPPGPWVCPKCHCDWMPSDVDGMIVWHALPIVEFHRKLGYGGIS